MREIAMGFDGGGDIELRGVDAEEDGAEGCLQSTAEDCVRGAAGCCCCCGLHASGMTDGLMGRRVRATGGDNRLIC